MSRTFIRQDVQIRNSDVYDDTVAPSATNYETNPTHIEDDLNSIRSMLSFLKDQQAGNWYDQLAVPSTLEAGSARAIDDLNDALHLVEKKRVLRCVYGLKSISIASAGDQFDILGTGELPGNTTAAVGAVTTLGTVVAEATTFGTAGLDEVAGSTAISPKNLVQIVDAATRDPILSSGRQIYGLLQSETATDGHTITDATATRVQISFVRLNATGNDLELIPSGDMDGQTYDYCYVERVRYEDLNEGDFLGGASVDVPAGSTVTRQVAYDNQGTTAVDLTTNATLDLEGPGLVWAIRDDAEANLIRVIEGSAGGTSEFEIGSDVDSFDNNAIVNDFSAGVTVNSGGTRPVAVGVTDGVVGSTAGDFKVLAASLLALEDGNKSGSGYATDLVLSDASSEWDDFETAFGEVSLLNAIVQANSSSAHRKVQAEFTANVSANNDISGPANDNNLDLNLGDLSGGSFVDDYDFFFNGNLLRNGANAAADEDIYPGTSLANGQVRLEFDAVITPAPADKLTLIAYA